MVHSVNMIIFLLHCLIAYVMISFSGIYLIKHYALRVDFGVEMTDLNYNKE